MSVVGAPSPCFHYGSPSRPLHLGCSAHNSSQGQEVSAPRRLHMETPTTRTCAVTPSEKGPEGAWFHADSAFSLASQRGAGGGIPPPVTGAPSWDAGACRWGPLGLQWRLAVSLLPRPGPGYMGFLEQLSRMTPNHEA